MTTSVSPPLPQEPDASPASAGPVTVPEAGRPDRGAPDEVEHTSPARSRRDRLFWYALEAAVSVATAVLFLAWSRSIEVDPLDRKGQVSGLAALQFRFAVVAVVLVTAMVVGHRLLTPGRRSRMVALGCAVIAGLTTGLVAGGIDVALRGTQFGLWAGNGDYRWILQWIDKMHRGEDTPDHYPPIIFWLIRGWSTLSGQPSIFAIKEIQLVGTALFGPAAYLTWRLTLRPVWALGIGVVAMLPFIEPVKPYPQITLVMLIPVLVAYMRVVRRTAGFSLPVTAGLGVAFGAGLGLLFLLYSGWFVWSAAGAAAAFLLLAPWRSAWRKVLLLASTTLVTFLLLSWVHIRGLLAPTGGATDDFFYFDTDTEPTYFAMWRNDRPADVGPVWPPLGELGGVGLFTILLAVGLGLALWFGWRRSVVITVGFGAVGSWLLRMWLASEQWETLTVRLYPRTTMIMLSSMLILAGFGIMYGYTALRQRLAEHGPAPAGTAAGVPVGLMLIPLLLILASAGSWTADHYMPNNTPDHTGNYAWEAQTHLYPGTKHCSYYGQLHKCGKKLDNSTSPAKDDPITGKSRSLSPTPTDSPVAPPTGSPAVKPSGSPAVKGAGGAPSGAPTSGRSRPSSPTPSVTSSR